MDKKMISRISMILFLAAITLVSTTVFSSCSKDDEFDENVLSKMLTFKEANGKYIFKYSTWKAPEADITFTVPSNMDGKEIDLSKNGDWTVDSKDIKANGKDNLLDPTSSVFVKMVGKENIELRFNLKQTIRGGEQKRKGEFAGKANIQ